jgi:hypothetical protein
MKRLIIKFCLLFLTFNVTFLYGQSSNYNILIIRDDVSGTPELIYNDVSSLGYNAFIKGADSINYQFLQNYHAVILSSGKNPISCSNDNMRGALTSYVDNVNGGVIVEGGHVGYNVYVHPGYMAFRNKVIKINGWHGDDGGNLLLNSDHKFSSLINFPNSISHFLILDYEDEYDQDICTVLPPAQLLFMTERNTGKAGILAFPNVTDATIVNMFFNYSTLTDRQNAKEMLENFLAHIIQNTISIKNISSNIPEEFKLYQNYPNPFNPQTNIRFDLSKPSMIILEIYDAIGRLIEIPANGFYQAGEYIFQWNSKILESGIYYYVLRTNDTFDRKKMIKVK